MNLEYFSSKIYAKNQDDALYYPYNVYMRTESKQIEFLQI